MAYVTTYKKNARLAYKANDTLQAAYTAFKSHSSPQLMENWQIAKRDFELWMERKERIYRSHFDTELFRFGNNPERLMANLARGRRNHKHITALRGEGGNVQTDPKWINVILQEFYKTLYSDSSNESVREKGKEFLQKVAFRGSRTNRGIY